MTRPAFPRAVAQRLDAELVDVSMRLAGVVWLWDLSAALSGARNAYPLTEAQRLIAQARSVLRPELCEHEWGGLGAASAVCQLCGAMKEVPWRTVAHTRAAGAPSILSPWA